MKYQVTLKYTITIEAKDAIDAYRKAEQCASDLRTGIGEFYQHIEIDNLPEQK